MRILRSVSEISIYGWHFLHPFLARKEMFGDDTDLGQITWITSDQTDPVYLEFQKKQNWNFNQ